MTVENLIKWLSDFPGDKPVSVQIVRKDGLIIQTGIRDLLMSYDGNQARDERNNESIIGLIIQVDE
jgi:hypothetical protein